jgi:antitoxin YefM
MNAIKYSTTVKNGKLDLPFLDLPEGTVVEAILLVDQSELDETSYLLSSDANRRNLIAGLEELQKPQNYIYVDSAIL